MAERALTPRKGFGADVLEASNRSGAIPFQALRAQIARGPGTTPDLESGTSSDQGANQFSFELLLERPGGASIGGAFVGPVPRRPAQVTDAPSVTGHPGAHSDEYSASLRRRTLGALAQKVGELADLRSDDRFMFAVDGAIQKVEEALQEFAQAKREGNTREILRTLLNTLRNGGWERYKPPEVARAIQEFLARLSGAEWIVPEQVNAFHELVDERDLNSLTLPAAQWPE